MCLGIQKLQSEWDNTNNGAIIKTFLADDRRQTNQTNTNELKIFDGKLRSYLYRFTIIDDQKCPCQTGS